MIFSNGKSIENSISVNGVNLQKVDNLRYLGVCIDHQIIWKNHIAYTIKKLSKSIAIIYMAIHILDTNPDTIFIIQYLNHILIIALKYREMLI